MLEETGFADVVDIIFGFDPGKPGTLGLVIVNSRETPGLGDKILKDTAFVNGFNRVTAPLAFLGRV